MNFRYTFSWVYHWHWAASLLGLLATGYTSYAQATLYNQSGSTLNQTGSLYNAGTFQNAGFYIPTSGTLLVAGGDFLNTGNINASAATGTVKLVESTASRGHILSLNGQALPNLELDVPASTTMGNDGTVLGTLTLRNGHLITSVASGGNYVLLLGADASLVGETDAHYVKGRLAQGRGLSGSSPINFSNMGLIVNPAGNSFGLTVERRAGLNQAGVSYGTNPAMPSQQGIDRIWGLNSTTTTLTTPVSLTLSWLAADDHGLTFSGNNAQVWRSDDRGTSWVPQGAVKNGANRSVTVDITQLNAWYTVSTTAAPLPVTLTNFTAQLAGKEAVALDWNTASEVNTDRFEVERSQDGVAFMRLKIVAAKGNSTSAVTYAYRDAILPSGASSLYYRLRIVDHDQSARYSPVRVVALTETDNPIVFTLNVAPNPAVVGAAATLWVTSPDATPGTLTILNAIGQVVGTHNLTLVTGAQELPLSIQSLPAGMYALRLQASGRTATAKLIIR